MTVPPPTLFETARAELRAIGIDLTMHPGTWCVNFHGAGAETAYFTDDLADAIEHGRAMAASALAGFIARGKRAQEAADRALAAAAPPQPIKRRRRPQRMTPKAVRRRRIKAHNRRLRAQALRQLAKRDDDKAE